MHCADPTLTAPLLCRRCSCPLAHLGTTFFRQDTTLTSVCRPHCNCCTLCCGRRHSLMHLFDPSPHPPQDDPVPRALLSADPAFLALKQSSAVAGLLRLREQWLGQGVLSPTRFLFHPAGDVYLVR